MGLSPVGQGSHACLSAKHGACKPFAYQCLSRLDLPGGRVTPRCGVFSGSVKSLVKVTPLSSDAAILTPCSARRKLVRKE